MLRADGLAVRLERARREEVTLWLRNHLGLIGYLVLAIGVAIGFYFLNQSRTALCALRLDQDQRIEAQQDSIIRARDFLVHNPHGGFGFTRKEILIQVSTQQRLLDNTVRSRNALDSLWCGKGTQ